MSSGHGAAVCVGRPCRCKIVFSRGQMVKTKQETVDNEVNVNKYSALSGLGPYRAVTKILDADTPLSISLTTYTPFESVEGGIFITLSPGFMRFTLLE